MTPTTGYWTADKRFGSPRQVTDAYPEIFTEFAWGTKTLVEYKNSKGQRLQATLTLPAGYEPGKKYPMLVYFYERMSDRHHNFSFLSTTTGRTCRRMRATVTSCSSQT